MMNDIDNGQPSDNNSNNNIFLNWDVEMLIDFHNLLCKYKKEVFDTKEMDRLQTALGGAAVDHDGMEVDGNSLAYNSTTTPLDDVDLEEILQDLADSVDGNNCYVRGFVSYLQERNCRWQWPVPEQGNNEGGIQWWRKLGLAADNDGSGLDLTFQDPAFFDQFCHAMGLQKVDILAMARDKFIRLHCRAALEMNDNDKSIIQDIVKVLKEDGVTLWLEVTLLDGLSEHKWLRRINWLELGLTNTGAIDEEHSSQYILTAFCATMNSHEIPATANDLLFRERLLKEYNTIVIFAKQLEAEDGKVKKNKNSQHEESFGHNALWEPDSSFYEWLGLCKLSSIGSDYKDYCNRDYAGTKKYLLRIKTGTNVQNKTFEEELVKFLKETDKKGEKRVPEFAEIMKTKRFVMYCPVSLSATSKTTTDQAAPSWYCPINWTWTDVVDTILKVLLKRASNTGNTSKRRANEVGPITFLLPRNSPTYGHRAQIDEVANLLKIKEKESIIVSFTGTAGSGKTHLASQCCWYWVADNSKSRRCIWLNASSEKDFKDSCEKYVKSPKKGEKRPRPSNSSPRADEDQKKPASTSMTLAPPLLATMLRDLANNFEYMVVLDNLPTDFQDGVDVIPNFCKAFFSGDWANGPPFAKVVLTSRYRLYAQRKLEGLPHIHSVAVGPLKDEEAAAIQMLLAGLNEVTVPDLAAAKFVRKVNWLPLAIKAASEELCDPKCNVASYLRGEISKEVQSTVTCVVSQQMERACDEKMGWNGALDFLSKLKRPGKIKAVTYDETLKKSFEGLWQWNLIDKVEDSFSFCWLFQSAAAKAAAVAEAGEKARQRGQGMT